MTDTLLSIIELNDAWPLLSTSDRVDGFLILSRPEARDLFDLLDERQRAELLLALPPAERKLWMRALAPDDAADVVQELDHEEDRRDLLDLLEAPVRKEVSALLAYAEDEAGGLMNPRFARLRPDMTVDEAISYLRRQRAEHVETIYYAYVLERNQKLLGVVSLRDLVAAQPATRVEHLMERDLISVQADTDQELVSHLFAEHDLAAMPVVDEAGIMKGIVTVDDIVDVVREEATEDMHKIGGTEALDAPYLEVHLREMLFKRVGWLAALVLLGFLSVLAMRSYEHQLDEMVLLALFVPLIISSGGNSGAQAATLIVRAMALHEVRSADWWRVFQRELLVGALLGTALGAIGFGATLAWQVVFGGGVHPPAMVGLAVAVSIVAVALWGTLAGAMLPFGLRLLGSDPASASAPLVATLVDASGLVIYFTIASVFLSMPG